MISDTLKNKINAEVEKQHYVGENNVIELYADYRDTADFLLDTVYNNRNGVDLEALVQEQIDEAYLEETWRCEDAVLEAVGVVGTDLEDEAKEYLQNTYFFTPPFDHYLDQEICVNIMLATDEERNRDCVGIHEQYLAMEDPEEVWNPEETLAERTGLSWLLEQQGSSMAELQQTLKEYDAVFNGGYFDERPKDADGREFSLPERIEIFNETHDPFLTSVCQELENHSYFMGVMTVLAKMSIREFIEMQRGEKQITMPQNADIGIFNPWNGSGSCLEIELKKPLVFSSDLIRDVQVEGAKMEFEYSVNNVYGLVGSCWKPVKSIEAVSRDEKEVANDKGNRFSLEVVERKFEDGDIRPSLYKYNLNEIDSVPRALEEAIEKTAKKVLEDGRGYSIYFEQGKGFLPSFEHNPSPLRDLVASVELVKLPQKVYLVTGPAWDKYVRKLALDDQIQDAVKVGSMAVYENRDKNIERNSER